MERPKKPAAESIPADNVLVDLPYGHWAVLRQSITRAAANQLREELWHGGVTTGAPSSGTFTESQMAVWEEVWAKRVGLYVRSWDFLDAEDKSVLPAERSSLEFIPDQCYQSLIGEVAALLAPAANPVEAATKSIAPERLGAGATNGRTQLAPDTGETRPTAPVVDADRPTLP